MGQMSVSGQGLNPGITLEAAIVYRATARYEGLAGQFSVSGAGEFGRSVDQQMIFDIINDSGLAADARLRLIQEIIAAMQPTTQPAGPSP